MQRTILVFALGAATGLAQYTVEPAGALPPEVTPAFAALLLKEGAKVTSGATPVCEIWLRNGVPSGPPPQGEADITNATIPHGALLGVIRYSGRGGSDRRGQNLKPGVYTLRFSYHPINGDHLGVAPQRDFLIITPMADDIDPAPVTKFDDLMGMSRKASGTPHPAALSFTKSSHGKFPDVSKEGEQDWLLHAKAGDFPMAIIVVGKAE